MSNSKTPVFPYDRKPRPGGGHYHYRLCTCSKCGTRGYWQDNTAGGAPADLVAQGFRAKNWEMDAKGRGTCPSCLGLRAPYQRLTKSQKRDAYLRSNASQALEAIAEVPPTPAPTPQQETTPMVEIEAPRQPSREDRRRIQDELELVYNVDLQRYKASWTDNALASKLGVPRAWVSEERDRAYGPEKNDAEIERLAELQLLVTKVTAAGDAAMQAAENAMAAADEAERLVAELKTKLGAVA